MNTMRPKMDIHLSTNLIIYLLKKPIWFVQPKTGSQIRLWLQPFEGEFLSVGWSYQAIGWF